MNRDACGATWQWPPFEAQHQRREFPCDFIWSSINTLYFHFKMQIPVYQTETELLKISKTSPFWEGVQGAWYGTQHTKNSQVMQRTRYRKKFFPLVEVRHQGHNQQVFCQKRFCGEKASCVKDNPWTTVHDCCYPLSFHLYSHLNNFEEQRWTEK